MGARQYKRIETWVEAIHYTGINQQEIEEFVGYKLQGKTPAATTLIIRNPSGETTLSPGQWIIKGRSGADDKKKKPSFYSMDNGPFSLTYDTRYPEEMEDEGEIEGDGEEFELSEEDEKIIAILRAAKQAEGATSPLKMNNKK